MILFFVFNVSLISAQQYAPISCGTTSNPPEPAESQGQNCNNSISNFLLQHRDDMVPQGIARKLRIRTNVIFAQNEQGEGNFSVSNAAHMSFFDRIFADANQRLESLVQESCNCSEAPAHYNNIHIEFVPTYIEVRDNFAWDHANDPNPTNKNSFNKPYLNYINTLARQSPGYQDGFNVIITTYGLFYNKYVYENPDNRPLWELGYNGGIYNNHAYSAFPTYNLAHPAMWHYPDLYLIYINGLDHLGGEWWLETHEIPHDAGAFLHEYGHYFDLIHVGCSQNIMKQGSDQDRSLTGCQVRNMYETLMTKNLRKYVICEDRLNFDLNVDTDETWRMNLRVFGDVRVKPGSKLTITCEVHLSPNARIIVERGGQLILDGGVLTGNCDEVWKGVVVEGDVPGKQAQSGKVILKNGAVIEHAKDAVSMNPDHRPWDNGGLQNYYGGIIEASDATIRKCRRGVEFMKYGRSGTKDKSTFNGVVFENIQKHGVTVWADDGVVFDNCTFRQIGQNGVLPYDCEVIVRSNNTFEQQPVGVDILTTYPIIFSSKIGKEGSVSNTFACQQAAVNIQSGGNVEPLTITNNIATGGNHGVKQNGSTLFWIENNRFSGHLTALEFYEGGTNYNQVKANEIQASFLGSHAIKPNTGLNYRDNCFSANQLVDIFVSDGSIFPWQGDMSIAAGNCFTKNGKPEVDNDAGTGPVIYFIKNGTPLNSCKFPVNLRNVTLMQNAAENANIDCGPGFTEGENEFYCDFDASLPIQQLKQQRLLMLQELGASSSGSQSLSALTLKRCIETLEALIGQKMLAPGSDDPDAGKENAIAFYTSAHMDFKDWATAYGIMVHYEELSRASTFLNSVSVQNQEQARFVGVQNINLAYLAQSAIYQLSPADSAYLHLVGTSEGAFSGYARSLYEVLTGQRIAVEIPEVSVEERDGNFQEGRWGVKASLYPNPSKNGTFNLQLAGLPKNGSCSISLFDATGREQFRCQLASDGQHQIGNDAMPTGLYLLTVRDEAGSLLYQSKLMIIH